MQKFLLLSHVFVNDGEEYKIDIMRHVCKYFADTHPDVTIILTCHGDYKGPLIEELFFFFFQAEDGIRDLYVTGVQTCLFRSFTVAWLGWEFDLPDGAIRMRAPAANVNGPVRHSIIAAAAGSHLARLGGSNSYCAADAVQGDAQLIVKAHFDDPGRVLPRAGWAFAHVEEG